MGTPVLRIPSGPSSLDCLAPSDLSDPRPPWFHYFQYVSLTFAYSFLYLSPTYVSPIYRAAPALPYAHILHQIIIPTPRYVDPLYLPSPLQRRSPPCSLWIPLQVSRILYVCRYLIFISLDPSADRSPDAV